MVEPEKLGRYQLRRVLGKGAMGVVYEGYDPVVNRQVAIKTILRNAAIDAETAAAYSERFKREAQAAGRLNHSNIVHVYDFAEEGDVAYLVMEHIQGRELRSYFEAKQVFEPAEAVRIMGELLDALDFAHEAGVIHRDVKPANVMLDVQRHVKLADFGVARIQDSDRSMAGTMVGTPAFMSPEQIKGGKVDRRTDIFSAGVILYQLLTGEQPFKGEGAWTVAKKIVEEDPPAPSSVLVSVSPAFDAVVKKALAKLPPQRFANARDFAAALREALASGRQSAGSAPTSKPKVEPRASDTELEFWRAIQGSTDAAEFEFYLDQFPQGTYATLARHKIAKLKEPIEVARKEAEDKARAEAAQAARKEAEAKARKEAEERTRREAEERKKQEAAENARREAEEKARREAAERARQAEALARLKAQEAAHAKAKAVDSDATVSIGREEVPGRGRSSVIPALAAVGAVALAVAAYLLLKAPAPPPSAPVAATPVPPKVESPVIDVEKIRRETEERVRREYAEKSAAEQAALAKASAEKEIAEKAAAARLAVEKAAQDKTLAAKVAAEKAQAEKAAAEKLATEKAAAEKAAAELAAKEKAAAEKVAAERAAAEKAATEAAEKARKLQEAEELRKVERETGQATYFGVRVGDGVEHLQEALGKPQALRSLGRFDAYTYRDPFATSPSTPSATFYVSKETRKVQAIHLAPTSEKAPASSDAARPGWPSVGDQWQYRARTIDPISNVGTSWKAGSTIEVKRIDGNTVIERQGSSQREIARDSRVAIVGIQFSNYILSPYLHIQHPLAVGAEWKDLPAQNAGNCSTHASYSCKFSAKVVAMEKVTVAAGTFDAYRVEVKQYVATTDYHGQYERSGVYWYAPAAKRYVKIRWDTLRGNWTPSSSEEELHYLKVQ